MFAGRRDLGPLLGAGRTAEVFAWESGRVLKLYRSGWSEDRVVREQENTARVHALGAPAPASYGVEQIEGRYGVVLERVAGPTLLAVLMQQPWKLWRVVTFARLSARLQLAVHALPGAGLPDQLAGAEEGIRASDALSEAEQERAVVLLRSVPPGDRLCHGDFHPDNIIMSGRGPVIIDWPAAVCGNPLADFAHTQLQLESGTLPTHLPAWQRWLVRLLRTRHALAFERAYRAEARSDRDELEAWRALVAVQRLGEEIDEERERMLRIMRARLRADGPGGR